MPELVRDVSKVQVTARDNNIDSNAFLLKCGGAGKIRIKVGSAELLRLESMSEVEKVRALLNEEFLMTHVFKRDPPDHQFAFRSRPKSPGKPRRFRMGFRVGDSKGDRKVCMARGRLHEDTSHFLRTQQDQPDPRKDHHHEIGAAMRFKQIKVDKMSMGPELPLFEITIRPSTVQKGDHDGCDVPASRINCHTHPSGEYPRQGVRFAWASKDDVLAIREKALDETENCIVHLVCATEGFYVISLNSEMLSQGGDLVDKIEKANVEKYYKVRLPALKGGDRDGFARDS